MIWPAQLGFALLPKQGWRSLGLALLIGLAFGCYMALADAAVFADIIPPVQRAMVAELSVADRIAFHARGVLLDEVVFRGIGITAIAWSLALLTKARGGAIVWPAILLVALLVYPAMNWAYFGALEPSALPVLRALTLQGAAGVLWGWLYWRHGWLSGLVGHMAAHLALQPLL